MAVIHQLTGYGKKTRQVEHEVSIPEAHLGYVRDVFGVSKDSDPGLTGGAYPIEADRLDQLTYYLGELPDRNECTWFLEAYAEALEEIHELAAD